MRRVVIEEKWRLISRFSVHFEQPFDQLITRARAEDMDRINELISIRDFIDSMNVWAEKPSVLVSAAVLFLMVLLIGIIGLSNLMTQHIVPAVSRHFKEARSEDVQETFGLAAVGKDASWLQVDVTSVDDTMVACWGDSLAELLDRWPVGVNEPGVGQAAERARHSVDGPMRLGQ